MMVLVSTTAESTYSAVALRRNESRLTVRLRMALFSLSGSWGWALTVAAAPRRPRATRVRILGSDKEQSKRRRAWTPGTRARERAKRGINLSNQSQPANLHQALFWFVFF